MLLLKPATEKLEKNQAKANNFSHSDEEIIKALFNAAAHLVL